MENVELIILSDDDDDYDKENIDNSISCDEPSVLIVEMEEAKKKDGNMSVSVCYAPALCAGKCYRFQTTAHSMCYRLCFTSHCTWRGSGCDLLSPCWGAASCTLWLPHLSLHVRWSPQHTTERIFWNHNSDTTFVCPQQGHRLWGWGSCGWKQACLWSVLLLCLRQAGFICTYHNGLWTANMKNISMYFKRNK